MAQENERTGSLGFEDKLWRAADSLRNNVDPSEYKHVVLGLIFLKYIADAFEERQQEMSDSLSNPESDEYIKDEEDREGELEFMLEDRDFYTSEHVFWVPREARWSHLQANATQTTIGKMLDDAMDLVEDENESLRGVLPKIYAAPYLNHHLQYTQVFCYFRYCR